MFKKPDNQQNEKIINNFFSSLYKTYGKYSTKSIGWSTKESQEIRFKLFLEYIKPEQSVLDVGCGFGDFYEYSKVKNINYLGIDINKNFVNDAKQKHSAQFINTNIFNIKEKFNWCIASGIFCYKIDQYESYVKEVVYKMCELAKTGIMINFLSKYSQNPNPDMKYVYPDEIVQILQLKTFIIRHDYKPNDFTLIIKTDKNV